MLKHIGKFLRLRIYVAIPIDYRAGQSKCLGDRDFVLLYGLGQLIFINVLNVLDRAFKAYFVDTFLEYAF